MQHILDFGCGAGRLYYALKDSLTEGQSISGCDLNERAIEWCKDLGYRSVIQNSAREPIEFPPGSFDLVVAVSVFTHLELSLQHHWAAELLRIIKPGGALFFTVHGPSFFPTLINQFTTHPYVKSLNFDHLGGDAVFADLRFTNGADEDPQGQREVATAHTDEAVRRIFKGFDVNVHDVQTSLAGHDIYLIVKH
jgi:SAM-dependent methyltransferase